MNLNVAGILIFLSVCRIVASSPDRAVDCRRFVFAPLCRGVAAKRGAVDTEHNGQFVYLTEESFRYLLRNLYTAISLLGMAEDEHDEVRDSAGKQEGESPVKTQKESRYNRLLRLMSDNRSGSKENLQTQDLDNL